jgi:hypothetical protein
MSPQMTLTVFGSPFKTMVSQLALVVHLIGLTINHMTPTNETSPTITLPQSKMDGVRLKTDAKYTTTI